MEDDGFESISLKLSQMYKVMGGSPIGTLTLEKTLPKDLLMKQTV